MRDLVPLAANLLPDGPEAQEAKARRYERDHFVRFADLAGAAELSALESADALLIPVAHKDGYYSPGSRVAFDRSCAEATEQASRAGKPLIIHGYTKDIVEPRKQLAWLQPSHLYLNASLIRSTKPPQASALPYFVPDCVAKYFSNDVTPAEKRDEPTVGFIGVAAPLRQPWTRTRILDMARLALTRLDPLGANTERLARLLGTNMKHAHRTRALLYLQRSPRVRTDFSFRPVGALVDKTYYREPDNSTFNTRYYTNIRDNLYTLCSRGTENYSIRFYETLCMGRIPIMVDTECCLPFEDQIDYERHCVWVPRRKVHRVADLVLAFHRGHQNRELRERQLANRQLWERFFQPAGYYREIGAVVRRSADERGARHA